MIKQISTLIFFFLLFSGFVSLQAQTVENEANINQIIPEAVPVSPTLKIRTLIGMLPTEVIVTLGSPESVYPLRGESAWQDDVIFYYPNHLYLFFYNNKVWQIRTDYRYTDSVLGISAWMKRSDTQAILGKSDYSDDGEDIYANPAGITRLETGYPLRMRLLFNDSDILQDIYLYRSDF